MMSSAELTTVVERFPRVPIANTPTPIESLPRLGADLNVSLSVKRDDYTGIAFGGNKVRQLEFYFGLALEQDADTVLITGAIQSNYARTAAAIARRLGLDCHVQLEERVPDVTALYRDNGNVLLDRLLGATIHEFPDGEDEQGADDAVRSVAEALRSAGRRPFVIPLGLNHPPLGALGYVLAAVEVASQIRTSGGFDEIVIASGSSLTHVGLLFGLRALGIETVVRGVCVRRDAAAQTSRVFNRLEALAEMTGISVSISPSDVRLTDAAFAPGYGRLNPATTDAIVRTARREGLFLDPTYTGKAMAGLFDLADKAELSGDRILFWHTGGQPALFAYADQLEPASRAVGVEP